MQAAEHLKLTSERLELIAGTVDLLRADADDYSLLSRRLQVRVPNGWPPEYLDAAAMNYAADYIEQNTDAAGWMLWFLILRDEGIGSQRTLIGTCGFKGRPDVEGTVEIGYSVVEKFRRRGYATESVETLCAWAFAAHPEVTRVIAETYPELVPSIRVLEKSGFRFIGDGSEDRVIRYELPRVEKTMPSRHR